MRQTLENTFFQRVHADDALLRGKELRSVVLVALSLSR